MTNKKAKKPAGKTELDKKTRELEEIIDHVKAETSALKKMIQSIEKNTNQKKNYYD